MQIIIGLLIISFGFLIVWKTEGLVTNLGRVYFFEKYLGSEGGSRLGYKLIGLFIIFIGLLVVSGMIENFLMWILGPLLRAMQVKV